jgi:hypothetical protein
VKKILLISLSASYTAWSDPKLYKPQRFRRRPNAGDSFLMKRGLTHNSALTDVLALQFKLRLDQD